MSFYSQDSDVVRRKFTPKETLVPTQGTVNTVPTGHAREKMLASEMKTSDRSSLINFQEKVRVVDSTENSGFHCSDCKLFFKDSVSFLDHVNSRLHQRNLGIEMRVEKSSFEQVLARIEAHKTRMSLKSREISASDVQELLREKLETQNLDRVARKLLKKQKRIESKNTLREEQDVQQDVDVELQNFMGFSNFKKSQ